MVRDSYLRFFDSCKITKEQLFTFGIQETISVDIETAKTAWDSLKHSIENNKEVYIRGFGRNAGGSDLYQAFYSHILNNEFIKIDRTNNSIPRRQLRDWTGYSKTPSKKFKMIQNYQISHVFGRTKNVYAFTAPWNIVYMPKILDPFTGHEAKGAMIDEYTNLFQRHVFSKFEPLIADFNDLMMSSIFNDKINSYFTSLERDGEISVAAITNLKKSVTTEFEPISV